MKVKVTAITQPLIRTLENTRFLETEEFIVYCARVSNPNNQLNLQSVPKLLKYCIEHEHWSIFEQVSMTVEIQTSRDISAQIIRHKSFAFQEFSQRYSEVQELESFNIRKQADKNRQSSSEDLVLTQEELETIRDHVLSGLTLYKSLIEKGAARESARKVLPLCSQTTLYMTGSIRSWIHYLMLRTKEDTQLEHRQVAQAIQNFFLGIFPNISKALGWLSDEEEKPEPQQENTSTETIEKNTN